MTDKPESFDHSNSIQNFFRKNFNILLALVISIACVNLFLNLNTKDIHDWDESRHGVSAYEMNKNGNYIVTTYLEDIEYWNLKPPLGLWLISLSYKIFGNNGFALRFPSALSGLGCILLIMMMQSSQKQYSAAIWSGIILTSTYPFFSDHSTRTGDFDAQLTFLVCGTVFCLQIIKRDRLRFALLGLILAAVFLLKSFAVIYPAAIIFFYFLFSKNKKIYQPQKNLAILIIMALTPLLIWGYLRYLSDGFIFFEKMINYDLLKRSSNAIEGHHGGWGYYFIKILQLNWYWCLVLLIALLALRKQINLSVIKKYQLYILWIAVPLAIATLVQTKLYWYIMPVYPALSVMIGISIQKYFENKEINRKYKLIFIVFVCIVTVIAEGRIVRRILKPNNNMDQQVLREIPSAKPGTNHFIYSTKWRQSTIFVANVTKSYSIGHCDNVEQCLESANTNDLLLLERAELRDVKDNKIQIVSENEQYLIVKIPGPGTNSFY